MEKLVLTKEEFIYLYNLCEGNHVNYDYIAMVPDIQQRHNSYRNTCNETLSHKNIIDEFWGDVSVPQKTSLFLSPIWNGEYEAFISRISTNDRTGIALHIHKQGNEYRTVRIMEACVEINNFKEIDFFNVLSVFMPILSAETEDVKERSLIDSANEIIVLKSINNETKIATVDLIYLIDDHLYLKLDDEHYRLCERETYQKMLWSLAKGV